MVLITTVDNCHMIVSDSVAKLIFGSTEDRTLEFPIGGFLPVYNFVQSDCGSIPDHTLVDLQDAYQLAYQWKFTRFTDYIRKNNPTAAIDSEDLYTDEQATRFFSLALAHCDDPSQYLAELEREGLINGSGFDVPFDSDSVAHFLILHVTFPYRDLVFEYLLSHRPELVDYFSTGVTPLILCAKYYRSHIAIRMALRLIEAKADINLADSTGRTPLSYACADAGHSSSLGIVKALVRNGANVNQSDNQGNTPLMYAVSNTNRTSTHRTVDYLLRHGATNNRSVYDDTCLLAAARLSNSSSSPQTVRSLAQTEGFDWKETNKDGWNALHLTVLAGSVEATGHLLALGADVNSVNSRTGFTPLHLAIKNDNVWMAKYLISNGADVKLLTNLGDSPLSLALTSSNGVELVTHLLKNGADPYRIVRHKMNSFQLVRRYCEEEQIGKGARYQLNRVLANKDSLVKLGAIVSENLNSN